MKKITKSFRRAIAQSLGHIVVPAATVPSGVVCNVGADHIVYKFLETIDQQAKFDIGAQITRDHPAGKAMTIFDTDGSTWYSITAKESVC